MPDGRVFVAGSNINALPGPPTTRHEEVEIFAPWYCCADRPRIISAPQVVDSGGGATRVEVHVRGDNITRFTLVRASSFTHSFNPDERNISLISHRIDEGHYWFKVPARPVPVPGWYMLFAVTYDHSPSEAVWVRLGSAARLPASSGDRATSSSRRLSVSRSPK